MIYIWVRATTEWRDEQVFREQLADDFRPKVEAWNAVFDMPYHVFRQRIKDVAQLNLSRVSDAVCAAIDEIPDGALVVPVDDDDWLAPELGEVLAARVRDGATGYHWDRTFLEPPPTLGVLAGRFVRYTLGRRKPNVWTCSSNSYALRKSSSTVPLLTRHTKASAYFDSQPEKVRRVPGRLSVMNRTLASKTSLGLRRSSVTRRELVRMFHRYRELYARTELAELAWCRPYLRMMQELMGELRLRSRAFTDERADGKLVRRG